MMTKQQVTQKKDFEGLTENKGEYQDALLQKPKRNKGGFGFIGKTIKSVREEKGLRQIDLAELAGITQAQLSGYENCTNLPTPDLLGRIIGALNVDALVFAVKCLEDLKVPDPRNQLRIEEYEPIVNETLAKIAETRRKIHN